MSIDRDELQNPDELEEEPQPPVAHVRITYTGPVAPHWELSAEFGDDTLIDEFWQRAMARLQLLPPHDPQFRRNRERVNRDAERENVILEWDLGYDEEDAGDAASLGDKPSPTYAEADPSGAEGAPEAAGEPETGGAAAEEAQEPEAQEPEAQEPEAQEPAEDPATS